MSVQPPNFQRSTVLALYDNGQSSSSIPVLVSSSASRISEQITQVAKERAALANAYHAAFDLQQRITSTSVPYVPCVTVTSFFGARPMKIEDAIQALDAQLWRKVLYDGGLAALINHKQLKELEQTFKTEAPPATEQNLMATFSTHMEHSLEYFVDGAIELFSGLDRSYVTNDRICLSKKIILKGLGNSSGGLTWSSFSFDQHMLNDLNRILMVLDNQDPLALTWTDQPSQIAEKVKTQDGTECDLEHLYCRLFKNGNVHVVIKDLAKIDRINELISIRYPNSLGYRSRKAS